MKRNYWPLFFIGIFSFTFGMIIWTIMSSIKVPVHEDRSFLKKYQEVDDTFNNIMNSNKSFLSKYDVEFIINSKKFGLETQDIMYSQRVLEKKSLHRGLLNKGQNVITINVFDKKTKEKKNIEILLNVTKSIASDSDILLDTKKFDNKSNTFSTSFDINEENNWNITGNIKVNGDTGYIYMKTNAI